MNDPFENEDFILLPEWIEDAIPAPGLFPPDTTFGVSQTEVFTVDGWAIDPFEPTPSDPPDEFPE